MTEKINYASFWERLLSRVIDSTVYFMILITPISRISIINNLPLLLNNLSNYLLLILFFLLVILPLETLMVSYFGGTIGKLLMGLHIQKENGDNLSFKESFFRLTLGKAVSGLFFCLGYLWIFRNAKRQAWHDTINQAVVIRKIHLGWFIGLLILFIFILINFAIMYGGISGFISNVNFYSNILQI